MFSLSAVFCELWIRNTNNLIQVPRQFANTFPKLNEISCSHCCLGLEKHFRAVQKAALPPEIWLMAWEARTRPQHVTLMPILL